MPSSSWRLTMTMPSPPASAVEPFKIRLIASSPGSSRRVVILMW